jgi:transposase InsO family protein
VRHRPEHPNHVWSYDFVAERPHDGRPFKILNIIDEYSRECFDSVVTRRIRSQEVILTLADLFLQRECPQFVRSDNGPEFIARKLIDWMASVGAQSLFIEPGSPLKNGYVESFNGKMRYELLNEEIFCSLLEAKTIIEQWRCHYNTKRPHSSLGGRSPESQTYQPYLKLLEPDLLT